MWREVGAGLIQGFRVSGFPPSFSPVVFRGFSFILESCDYSPKKATTAPGFAV